MSIITTWIEVLFFLTLIYSSVRLIHAVIRKKLEKDDYLLTLYERIKINLAKTKKEINDKYAEL